jgi:hypothetical protein
VDNTRYISQIENTEAKAFVWLRPRRFGKSLFLDTLDAYYNVLYKNDFEKNFGHLWIGKHRTQDQGSYHVLRINFGSLDITSFESFGKTFHGNINRSIRDFHQNYNITSDIDSHCIVSMENLFSVITQQKKKVLVLIDEYDTMHNAAISEWKTVSSHGNKEKSLVDHIKEQNLFKSFFSLFKEWCQRGFVKVFVTGVTPLALSYFTSGFNEATHLHNDPDFSLMNGFTKKDVERGLQFIQPQLNQEDIQFALEFMEKEFNGYRFVPEQKETLFNSNFVLYYLNQIQKAKNRSIDQPVQDILSNISSDPNNRPTKGTLDLLSGLDVSDKTLALLLKLEPISLKKELHTNYDIETINSLGKVVDPSMIYSLMFYLGALTHTDKSKVNQPELKPPNLVSQKEFIERLKTIFDPNNSLGGICVDWLQSKDIQHLCDYLSKQIFSGFQNADVTGGEPAFSSVVYSCLKIGLLDTEWIVDRENPKENLYDDLEVSSGNEIFIMEFKSLQTIYFKECPGNWWTIATQWDKDILSKKSKDELLNMVGNFFLHNSKNSIPNISVRQVLENAKGQLAGYMQITKTKNPTKTVHGYVLIRVGLSAIISHKMDSM